MKSKFKFHLEIFGYSKIEVDEWCFEFLNKEQEYQKEISLLKDKIRHLQED